MKLTFVNTGRQTALSLFIVALFAILVWLVSATSSSKVKSDKNEPLERFLTGDVSMTLSVLRAVQGVLSALTVVAVDTSFQFLQWSLVSRTDGLSYLNLLAMTPMTGNVGAAQLLSSTKSTAGSRLWAVSRIVLAIVVWVSGIILFFKTTLITVYDTAQTYPVTAGVGPFNATYLEPFVQMLSANVPDYHYQIVPYSYFAPIYNLVINPMHSTGVPPINCSGPSCSSYLLTGGLEMVTPWIPLENMDYPLVKLDSVTSIHLEFETPLSDTTFPNESCDVYGAPDVLIGIKVCVADDTETGSYKTGLYVCTNGVADDICRTTASLPNITATARFYTRQATVIAARTNFSIMSVDDLTTPEQITDLDLPAYRATLGWLLNYTAANIPPPSSIAQTFWTGRDQYEDAATYGALLQSFQSVLAFPFWLFNANNYGNIDLQEQIMINSMPPQFYTQASTVTPYVKLKFDTAMFVVFVILQGLAMVFVWSVLVWIWCSGRRLPNTSSYPVFDVMFRTRVYGPEAKSRDILGAGSSDVIRMMKEARVYGMEDTEAQETDAFVSRS